MVMTQYLYKIVLVTCFLFVSCNYNTKQKKDAIIVERNDLKIIKIEIAYVNMYIMTPLTINCGDFENFFADDIESLVIQNDDEKLVHFSNYLDKSIRGKTAEGILNTRASIKLIYSNNMVEEICLGRHILIYQNKKYLIDDDFQKFILNITKSKR